MTARIRQSAMITTLPTPLTTNAPNIPHFIARQGAGVFYVGTTKEGQPLPEKRICSYLNVIAKTAGRDGNHGILLEWEEQKGVRTITKRLAVPRKHMVGDGLEFLRELEDKGVLVKMGQEKKVLEYLRGFETNRFINSVPVVGWHDQDQDNTDTTNTHAHVFVTPTRIYGASADDYIYQPEHAPTHRIGQAGTLEGWQQHVARYAVGNSRIAFAIATAFAGSLLNLASSQVDSGGFHFHGASSSGKSTAMACTASVWGRGGKSDHAKAYARTWQATAVAIETIAALHNDGCLLLDEISQADEKQAAKIPYMLGNGVGKERGNKSLTLRHTNTFRLMFVSNGEYTLEEHLKQKGVKVDVNAGQELRMLNIPADAGQGMGIVETLFQTTDTNTPAKLVEHLINTTTQHYGTAGAAWLEYITANIETITSQIPNAIQSFKQTFVPTSASSQANRAANRFALVAIAGELATNAGITSWTTGTATQAAGRCYTDWLQQFGGGDGISREHKRIVETIETFIDRNLSKFDNTAHSPNSAPVPDSAGCYTISASGRHEYWLLSRRATEIAGVSNSAVVAQALQAMGLIDTSEDTVARMPTGKTARVFKIRFAQQHEPHTPNPLD